MCTFAKVQNVRTIAVIDDNEDNGELLRAMLGDQYTVLVFTNGRDALESFHTTVPDLVLLDISMPVMDGNEVLKIMRQNEKLCKIPVVAITAHAMKGQEQEFLKSGFDAYISKPIVDDKALFDTIEKLLESKFGS